MKVAGRVCLQVDNSLLVIEQEKVRTRNCLAKCFFKPKTFPVAFKEPLLLEDCWQSMPKEFYNLLRDKQISLLMEAIDEYPERELTNSPRLTGKIRSPNRDSSMTAMIYDHSRNLGVSGVTAINLPRDRASQECYGSKRLKASRYSTQGISMTRTALD